MKNYAISKGIPAEDIFMDHAGFSTYETMYRAKEVFNVKAILVTQEYHLYRALYIGQQLGIQSDGISATNTIMQGWLKRVTRNSKKDIFQCIFKIKANIPRRENIIRSNGNINKR